MEYAQHVFFQSLGKTRYSAWSIRLSREREYASQAPNVLALVYDELTTNPLTTHLTTHPGVGVGDSTASPTSALLLSVLQESTGRIATILFAHRLGTALEPECKMYRLAADVFNDTAMVLDCLSPAFPKPIRVAVLSFSSCLRALCGVCAGSAKASLSAHFAKKGNLGEVNAVSLLISFFGLYEMESREVIGRLQARVLQWLLRSRAILPNTQMCTDSLRLMLWGTV
jgi:hypothetical protein